MPHQVATGHRPRTEPTAADLKHIEKWAAEGAAIIEMCRALRISHVTFGRWRKEHPAVSEALEAGRAVEHKVLHSKAFDIAMNKEGKYEQRLEADMVKWLLATRHSYRDKGDEQGHTTSGVNVNISLPGALQPEQFIIESQDHDKRRIKPTEAIALSRARPQRS